MIYAIFVAIIAAALFASQSQGEEVLAQNTGTPLSPFADAIGHAEGFYVADSRSNRNNNPGDFILAPPASNYTDKSDGTYAIFDNVADGWQALEDQLDLIRRGASNNYTTVMTFEQMAQKYSPDGWENWAKNVSEFLGAQPKEQIGAYL
jgi:hypothetical protein